MVRRLFVVAVMLASGAGGCAAPVRQPVAVIPAPVVDHGVIVAIRPVRQVGVAQGQLLAALGVAGGTMPADMAEFVVRQDDGRTLSVMQDTIAGFSVQQHVELIGGGRTRIGPIGS